MGVKIALTDMSWHHPNLQNKMAEKKQICFLFEGRILPSDTYITDFTTSRTGSYTISFPLSPVCKCQIVELTDLHDQVSQCHMNISLSLFLSLSLSLHTHIHTHTHTHTQLCGYDREKCILSRFVIFSNSTRVYLHKPR
jgi:hypothetical protein